MRRRSVHPFFSRLGCGAAVFSGLVLAVILLTAGSVPFSPGSLTAAQSPGRSLGGYASHAEFERACDLCHTPWQGVTAQRCQSCHDAIAAQRQSETGLHGRIVGVEQCEACHTDHKGRDAYISAPALARFDHERLTRFTLGRHQLTYEGAAVVCRDCHVTGEFAPEAVDCVSCHAAHDGPWMAEHRRVFGEDCLACHDGVDTMAAFDHARVFALEGAHSTLPCERCHQAQVFAGTPQACVGCHEEPQIHAGAFGLDCARCHTAVAWTPAQLTHHTFPLDHGDEGQIDCQTCHVETYVAYTCYNCHAHEPSEIREEHIKEAIFEFENCVECHATGETDG